MLVEMQNADTVLLRKHEGERQLGILRRRWEDNIKWILKILCVRVLIGFK